MCMERSAGDNSPREDDFQTNCHDYWLAYGAALNEIKAQHGENDKAFGQAVAAADPDKWPEATATSCNSTIDRIVRSAAMWASALTTAELAVLQRPLASARSAPP